MQWLTPKQIFSCDASRVKVRFRTPLPSIRISLYNNFTLRLRSGRYRCVASGFIFVLKTLGKVGCIYDMNGLGSFDTIFTHSSLNYIVYLSSPLFSLIECWKTGILSIYVQGIFCPYWKMMIIQKMTYLLHFVHGQIQYDLSTNHNFGPSAAILRLYVGFGDIPWQPS